METLKAGKIIIKISADGEYTVKGKGVELGDLIRVLDQLLIKAISDMFNISEKEARIRAGRAYFDTAESCKKD